MRRILVAGVLALTLPLPLAAQQPGALSRVTVGGLVFDSATGLPVAGATVTFSDARRVVFTDSLGRFSLETLPLAVDRIQVRQIGYATVTFEATIGREPPPLLVRLAPDPVPLQEITARADTRGVYTIEGTVTDSASGRPLPRAVVWFGRSGGSALTDSLGHYVYDGGRAGYESITVDVLGYERRVAARTIAQPWQRLDLALAPDPIVLRATAGLLRRMTREHVGLGRTPRQQVYTEQALARSGFASVRDFLVWLTLDIWQPSLTVLAPDGSLVNLLACPGGEPTTQAVLLDGRAVPGGMNYLPAIPLHDLYAVVASLWTPAAVGALHSARCAKRQPVAVQLYSKTYMRRILHAGLPLPWQQTPADTIPDAWRLK